ncbi:hypothetical protein IFO70_31210 [Phormidium tenue FACHB-886]|nr:hypothetical protein [Phormidium tenue FACHB-886]
MQDKQMIVPPVFLPAQVPELLPQPRFNLGQSVRWSCVPTEDFGRIVGIVYGNEGSVKAEGYHYAVALDPASPSYGDGILTDWGFEEDLELFVPEQAAGDRLKDS